MEKLNLQGHKAGNLSFSGDIRQHGQKGVCSTDRDRHKAFGSCCL